ncbi:MAG TPA: TraR/DksA C4-type zinc finger protein [Acidimicrobiales bacterium]|nr:TraR/DksA C4-type zinc finger protein [Acidimicrobiales bacterium]
MTGEQRAAFEALLAAERERTAATEAALVAEHEAVVEAAMQSNLDDEHDPEGATVGFERARVASLVAQSRRRLADLDRAAERLRTGAFGVCERCGQPIALERLAAFPTATSCVGCAEASGRSGLDRSGLDRFGLGRSGLDRSGLDRSGLDRR